MVAGQLAAVSGLGLVVDGFADGVGGGIPVEPLLAGPSRLVGEGSVVLSDVLGS